MGGLSEVAQSCQETTNTIIKDIKQLVMVLGILINCMCRVYRIFIFRFNKIVLEDIMTGPVLTWNSLEKLYHGQLFMAVSFMFKNVIALIAQVNFIYLS